MTDTLATETEPFVLLRTKLQKPRLPGDLIPRRRLLERLHAGLEGKLTLISAQAGAGKSTLLAQWIEECTQPGAPGPSLWEAGWLSLDEHDNDRTVFLSYLCGTIRTVFPSACEDVLRLLEASQTPPPTRVITTLILNELAELVADPSQEGGRPRTNLILALDDYQYITNPAIHELLSDLIRYLPQGIHLALASRSEPPLPLSLLRARREMTQLRSIDLRFTLEEAHSFLQTAIGQDATSEMTTLLVEKTEGWIVGLRLAALSMRAWANDEAFVQGFSGTSSGLIVEYLATEVLTRQSPQAQDFVLRTSILDRFCAPLCEVLTETTAVESQEIIERMVGVNLFLVPLDEEKTWYRYHHLFRDLLRHKLRQRYGAADISGLHACAAAWLAQNGLIDEALRHLLAVEDTAAAVALVARQRYDLMNRAQWPRLEQYLHAFPPATVDQSPELLVLNAWLLYHGGRFAELPAAVQGIEAALARATMAPEAVDPLQGEISVLRSIVSCFSVDAESTVAHVRQALAKTPRELWIVRIAARMYMAAALLMMDDVNGAYEILYAGFEEEGDRSNAFKATLLTTACNIHWMTADLQGLARAAEQVLALSRDPYSSAFTAWGHYHLGRARYHYSDLAIAEEHFAAVVQQPYLSYGVCYVYSACGLALIYQAQGRPEQAWAVVESAIAFVLETGNTTLLPVVHAFQAELALMQGQVAIASQWAAQLDPVPPMSPMYGLFSPHLTLVKVWLTQGTLASRGRAIELVDQVRTFCESSHTTRFLIEALALQALLYDVEGDEPAALASLEQAIDLAEPGGFIQLFVDLGPPMSHLLDTLRRHGVAIAYLDRILAAFAKPAMDERPVTDLLPSVAGRRSPLIDPLTPRELEVLALLDRHLTNREIAEELVVSPSTVKTHTLNIYRKLEVRGRKQATARAREIGILPPR